MRKFLQQWTVFGTALLLSLTANVSAQQLPNKDFENWNGAQFNGSAQPTSWYASNVDQSGKKVTFGFKETGRNGGSCIMTKGQWVGAFGIGSNSPGYFALGKPWTYMDGLDIDGATGGTAGGINWTHLPDTMSVWIKRTGDNWSNEDFTLLFYSWTGTSKGTSYKNKNNGCTDVSSSDYNTNEESDIRLLMDANGCGTPTKATQVAEGYYHARAQYNTWTNIKVPIYYFNNSTPSMANVIFAASNYPNFRTHDGIYENNALYVDDVEMIYASTIDKIYLGDEEWTGFNPKSSDIQVCEMDESATAIPTIKAFRGVGTLINQRGTKKTVSGRELKSSEMTISYGDLSNTPTVITVKSADNKSTTVYRIQFKKAASSNARLASIDINGTPLTGFTPTRYTYNYDLPYGTTEAPVVTAEKQEDEQKIDIQQPTSVNGTATIKVTAANGTTTATYTVTFKVGQLADNTLKMIYVNDKPVPGFNPTQTVYKVSLPTTTTTMPDVRAESAYPDGEQTIVYTAPESLDGGQYQISVTTPGNPVAKVYKLNFKLEASSYKYLADLQVVGEQLDHVEPAQEGNPTALLFKPEQMDGYVAYLKMGTTALPQIIATPGDDSQTITKEEGGLDGITRINVKAGNGDQAVYKLKFATLKSDNCQLKGILIGGQPLDNFDPNTYRYAYKLPLGTTELPAIEPIAGDEYQTIQVTTAGVNGTTRITVTAGSGKVAAYLIDFSVDAYTDNTLASLTVEGFDIGFEPEKNEYYVNLPQGTTALPKVSYTLQDERFQTVNERSITSGLTGDWKITVRPQSGASRTYIIHFTLATSSNTALKMIYFDGVPMKCWNGTDSVAFDPEVLEYTHILPAGESKLPKVTYDPEEASQRVLPLLENRVLTLTVTAESGAKREYKITFEVVVSANAYLNMIYLDEQPIEDFEPSKVDYHIQLDGPTCPAITVDKAPGQQVTITAPYAAGTAYIKVVAGSGDVTMYSIEFEAGAVETARLKDILVNGVSLEGFDPKTLHYTAEYSGQLPLVEGVPENDQQAVQVLWKAQTAYIYVTDKEGNTAAYSIAFTRRPSQDNTLLGIYENFGEGEQLIDGFNADQHNYSYELEAGSTLPVLTYKAATNAQVVFFGQLEYGKWGIIVEAENGTPAEYTVAYTVKPYDDATLIKLFVNGTLVEGFDPNLFDYTMDLDNGADMPQLSVESRPGQTILMQNCNLTRQEVAVYAENGAHNTYSITYTRKQSKNALLADILIDGVSLEGFNPNTFQYEDSLNRFEDGIERLVVPNVYPIGQLPNQTITTTYGRLNGITLIHVLAEDGETEATYEIAFPVRKVDNNKLAMLDIQHEEAIIIFKPDVTDYEVTLPFEDIICPPLIIQKGDARQRVDIISRPIGQTTQVIVYAENGAERTYNILFKRSFPTAPNELKSLTIGETNKKVDLNSNENRIYEIALPYNSRSLTVNYTKNYEEQTVFIQPGGVLDTTFITVKANRGDEQDVVYKLVPVVDQQNPAVLDVLRIDDVLLSGFDKNRFTYIYNVADVGQVPQITYEMGEKVRCSTRQNLWSWEATVTASGYTNTYKIFFHYPNEKLPNNGDFTKRVRNAKGTSYKPEGWNATNDFVSGYYSADYVSMNDGGPVQLYNNGHTSLGWFAIYGCAPAMLNLAEMTASHVVSGNSKTIAKGEIDFHNTPDGMETKFAYPEIDNDDKGALIRCRFVDNYNQEHYWDVTQKSKQSNPTVYKQNFDLSGVPVKAYDVIVDASSAYLNGGSGDKNAKMQVYYVHFLYNSTPKAVTVNGIEGKLNNKVFTVTLDDPEDVNIRSYEFNGEVVDQAQILTWGAPQKEGNFSVRTATIRNFAEDGSYTDGYSLQVKRPLDTRKELAGLYVDAESLTGFAPSKKEYTVALPAYRYYLPDVQPVPASSRQHVTTAYNETDSTVTISVTSEIGETNKYTVRFVTEYSSDVTLTNIAAEGLTYNPDKHEYDLTAENLPVITFVKKSDLQEVSLINGILSVTAEDGVTTGSYTINRVDPVYSPVGGIDKFFLNDAQITDFGGDKTTREAAKPDNAVLFTRANATDTVVFVQHENQMEWFVPGIDQVYTWIFKKDGELSSNTDLEGLLLNGEAYEDFMPSQTSYFFTSDETLIVEAVLAEETQTLNSEITTNGDTIHYSMEVTAENGETKTYNVFVATPKSGNNTLSAILLNGELLDGFVPEVTNYTHIIPLPEDGIKREEPQMPSITYIAGQEGQIITLERGKLNIDPTTIKVLSQDGKGGLNEYTVMIESEKSHCADLTGITVNGVALDHFEPGRHYYSTTLPTSENIVVDYMTDDRFQTNVIKDSTVIDGREYIYTVYVTAEDGHTSRYEVDIYIENQSNDAQLANILLDDKELVNFERALNKDLAFDPGQNNYIINVPAGTAVWPAVSAQLKMDGQQVDIIHKGKDSVVLHVIAVDKVTTNDYTLHFIVPKSKNTDLEMIYIDGKPLEGFDKDRHSYTYRLPIGKKAEKNVVEVVGQKAEDVQYIDPVEWNDEDAPKTAQATLRVYAEDEEVHSIDYDILFIATTSSIDTLAMIYADGDSLEGFDPHIYYYEQTLPVGTDAFPTLDADEGDPYQTLVLDTVSSTKNSLVRQFIVTALNGQEATYTVAYNIAVSAVDTLAMIFVNGPQLAGFKSNVYEYFCPFTAEEAKDLKDRVPVTCTPGDPYQDTSIVYLPETITGKTLGYKTVITATAQTGAQRIYTIHYPVSLSNDSTLEMIYINGEKIKDFSELLFSYKHEIGLDDALPVVTFDKKEEKQNVVPKIENDIVRLLVTAEDGVAKSEYVIAFARQKSAVITLKEIILTHNGVQLTTSEFPYRPDYFEYTVNLPYDGSKELMQQLPEISWIKADEEQTVATETVELPTGDILVVVHVTAPDGETQGEYSLTFHFLKPNDATLQAIYIRGVLLADFLPEEIEYTYAHPFGSTQADFFGLDAVTYDLSDPLANASMSIDENGTISIKVIAQDPNYDLTYVIRQVAGADNDNTLKMIWLDEVEMRDFDPQVTFYTYYLREGFDAPNVTALANSLNAKGVSVGIAVAGDTCKIICTAADNSKRTYRIFFAISDINDALTPSENDVIIKRVAGTNQLFIASLRQNVAFVLYDQNGHMVHFESSVPAADPNDVDVFSDIYGRDVLSNVADFNAGKLIDIIPGQIYIYGFYTSNKRFKSGKIRVLPAQ